MLNMIGLAWKYETDSSRSWPSNLGFLRGCEECERGWSRCSSLTKNIYTCSLFEHNASVKVLHKSLVMSNALTANRSCTGTIHRSCSQTMSFDYTRPSLPLASRYMAVNATQETVPSYGLQAIKHCIGTVSVPRPTHPAKKNPTLPRRSSAQEIGKRIINATFLEVQKSEVSGRNDAMLCRLNYLS